MPAATPKNKIKFNLKNVHIAILTKTDEGEYSYATPVALPGAVSLSLDAEGESNPFYADGLVYYRSVSNLGYSGELVRNLKTNFDAFNAALLSNPGYHRLEDSYHPEYFRMAVFESALNPDVKKRGIVAEVI